MTWSIVGTPTTSTAVTSGNVTGTESTGTAQGDLLIAVVSARSTPAFTLPSGWTIIGTQQSSGDTAVTLGIASGLICAAPRGASPPGLVWTRTAGDRGQVRIHTFRSSVGPITTVNTDGSVTSTMGATGTAISVSGFTTTRAGDLILFGVAVGDNGTVSAYANATNPLTWNTITGSSDNTGADGGTSSAWGVQAAAGATGNFTATSSISSRAAILIAAFKEPRATTITPAALPITGAAVAPTRGQVIAITPSSVPITGASITPVFDVAATWAEVTWAEIEATGGAAAYTLTITPASLPITGQTVTPTRGRVLAIAPSAVPITGQTVTPTRGRVISVTPSAVPITGASVTPYRGRVISITPSSVPITGQTVTPIFSAGGINYTITITASSVPISGAAIAPTRGRVIAITPSAVPIGGQAVALRRGRVIAITPSSVPITGQVVVPLFAAAQVAAYPSALMIPGF